MRAPGTRVLEGMPGYQPKVVENAYLVPGMRVPEYFLAKVGGYPFGTSTPRVTPLAGRLSLCYDHHLAP